MPEDIAIGVNGEDCFACCSNDNRAIFRDGSIRPLDPSVAAQLVSAMINAVAELPLWARGVTEQTVAALFARPLFLGIGCQTLPDKG